MRAVVTRVTHASVTVGGATIARIGPGLCALIGVGREDTPKDVQWLAEKIAHCRVFEDTTGKMNHSLLDTGGALLAVSQFTLYANVRKGNRPGFSQAMAPQPAQDLFDSFCQSIRNLGLPVQVGKFGAHMAVESLNDGPVTLLFDTQKLS